MSDKNSSREALGQRLKNAREYLGLSQEDAGKVLNLTRTAITKIENGARKVDAIELAGFAKLYRQPLSTLSGEEEAAPLTEKVMALARTASDLSSKDQEALVKFADFLRGKPPEE